MSDAWRGGSIVTVGVATRKKGRMEKLWFKWRQAERISSPKLPQRSRAQPPSCLVGVCGLFPGGKAAGT